MSLDQPSNGSCNQSAIQPQPFNQTPDNGTMTQPSPSTKLDSPAEATAYTDIETSFKMNTAMEHAKTVQSWAPETPEVDKPKDATEVKAESDTQAPTEAHTTNDPPNLKIPEISRASDETRPQIPETEIDVPDSDALPQAQPPVRKATQKTESTLEPKAADDKVPTSSESKEQHASQGKEALTPAASNEILDKSNTVTGASESEKPKAPAKPKTPAKPKAAPKPKAPPKPRSTAKSKAAAAAKEAKDSPSNENTKEPSQAKKEPRAKAAPKPKAPEKTRSPVLEEVIVEDEAPSQPKDLTPATKPTPKRKPRKSKAAVLSSETDNPETIQQPKGPSSKKAPAVEKVTNKPQPKTSKSAVKRKTADVATEVDSGPTIPKRRKVTFEVHEAISLNPNHSLVKELNNVTKLMSEVEAIDRELESPEAKAVVERIRDRRRLVDQINHQKEVISYGIYMQPKSVQTLLVEAYRENFDEDPFPRICDTDFDSDDVDPPTPQH
ncbi:hypothetical protein N7454_000255 [Penicillium verhagenii]|nr:hypothetical protein N7454_000255 [Penicillium verhagenii]